MQTYPRIKLVEMALARRQTKVSEMVTMVARVEHERLVQNIAILELSHDRLHEIVNREQRA